MVCFRVLVVPLAPLIIEGVRFMRSLHKRALLNRLVALPSSSVLDMPYTSQHQLEGLLACHAMQYADMILFRSPEDFITADAVVFLMYCGVPVSIARLHLKAHSPWRTFPSVLAATLSKYDTKCIE